MRFSDNGVTLEGPLDEDGVVDVWPKAETMLCDALDRDGCKLLPIDLLQQISEGLMGLYVVRDDVTGELLSAIACEAQEYPRSMVFNIAYCGGRDLHRWAGLLGALEAEAARLGCDTVRITGRPGWARIFPDYQAKARADAGLVIDNEQGRFSLVFMAAEGHPADVSRRTAADLLQLLQPSLSPSRLRELVGQATPEQRHWLKVYLDQVRQHPDVEAARDAGGEVVQFLFQQLRAAYGELSDDDFKAMVLLALDEGTDIAAD